MNKSLRIKLTVALMSTVMMTLLISIFVNHFFLDDYYNDKAIGCLYISSYDITIISLPRGINARDFYYSHNRRKESDKYYFDTAMEYFYISGDYCQENNDMV